MSHSSPAFDDVSVGDELPAVPVPITTSLVVGGARRNRISVASVKADLGAAVRKQLMLWRP